MSDTSASEPTKTSVSIDSCAWNKLFVDRVDLAVAFPPDRYSLAVTREVEIEILAIPIVGKDGTDNRELKAYIANSIKRNNVVTTSAFGFASVEPDGTLSKTQVYGGFDQATFQSDSDRAWYASNEAKALLAGKSIRPGSGLTKNQADASLAVRSFDSIVLTSEDKNKSGPLRLATAQGGRVVYLEDVEKSQLSLERYIAALS